MSDIIELKFKYGSIEIELKGSREDVEYFLNKVFSFLEGEVVSSRYEKVAEGKAGLKDVIEKFPKIVIKGGEPLTEILTTLFSSEWGREPRNLREVIEALETYGLYYSKSTVAVSLNRLVKRGVLRRIRGKDGVYRYVSVGKV
jgi:hypothetical protein